MWLANSNAATRRSRFQGGFLFQRPFVGGLVHSWFVGVMDVEKRKQMDVMTTENQKTGLNKMWSRLNPGSFSVPADVFSAGHDRH